MGGLSATILSVAVASLAGMVFAGSPSFGARERAFGDMSDLQRLCHLSDRDRDGRLSVSEVSDFFTMFGAAHGGVPEVELELDLVEVLMRRANPEGDGLSSSCEAFFDTKLAKRNSKLQQFHLSLTGDASERRLTFAAVGEAPSEHPLCTLSDGRNFTGLPYSYDVPARWWQPEGWVGKLYNVTFTHLQLGEEYSYSCKGSNMTYTFHTKATYMGDKPTTFATFGDMGTYVPLGFEVYNVLERSHAKTPFDFVLQQGDISYAGVDTAVPWLNISKDDEFEFVWDVFGRQIEGVAATSPWMTGVGNHEAWYNFSAFRARYPMPGSRSGGRGNFWYSFDYAGVHVVSASSEHDLSSGSPQLLWIENDLRKANLNRQSVPWVVFAIHRPLYSSDAAEYPQHSPGSYRLEQLEALLLENNVDVTVSGHQHAYERCHPSRNGTDVILPNRTWNSEDVYEAPGAPVHLMVGSAGAFQHERWIEPAPAWSGKRFNRTGTNPMDGYGFVRVTLFNRTHLRAQFESLSRKSSAFSDAFWVVRNAIF